MSTFLSMQNLLRQSKPFILQDLILKNKVSMTWFIVLVLWLVDVFYDERVKQDPSKLSVENKQTFKQLARVKLTSAVMLPAPPLTAQSQSLDPAPTIEIKAIKPESTPKSTPKSRPKSRPKSTPEPAEVNKVIAELAVLNSENIRFLLPDSNVAKERLLQHMYECENMQFGAVSADQPYHLSVLSKNIDKKFSSSQLLRVAHDYLSPYEHNLLQVYAANSQAVRIFPVELDYKLAQHIAAKLNGQTLRQFSARYFVRDSNVGLSAISVNEQAISEQWMLSSGSCL